MSKEIFLVVEGATEQLFCERVLAPYMALSGVYVHASQIRKKGTNGGDVRFSRAKVSILGYLKQRADTLVGTFVDYYGLKEWPELDAVRQAVNLPPSDVASRLQNAAIREIERLVPETEVRSRFFPFVSVHEFETLLFSNPQVLAVHLGVAVGKVEAILDACGSPEQINNSPQTAPSKRILALASNVYGKTTDGVSIAARIGIDCMRQQCPIFDGWLNLLESSASNPV